MEYCFIVWVLLLHSIPDGRSIQESEHCCLILHSVIKKSEKKSSELLTKTLSNLSSASDGGLTEVRGFKNEAALEMIYTMVWMNMIDGFPLKRY